MGGDNACPGLSQPATNSRQIHQWTKDLAARLDAHARGTGARLIEVITRAGLGFTLARTWPQTTRDQEDLLKHRGDARRFCPECGVKPRQEPAVVMPERHRSLNELERDGTWLDGTPLPETTAYPAPAAAQQKAAPRKENQMFGRTTGPRGRAAGGGAAGRSRPAVRPGRRARQAGRRAA